MGTLNKLVREWANERPRSELENPRPEEEGRRLIDLDAEGSHLSPYTFNLDSRDLNAYLRGETGRLTSGAEALHEPLLRNIDDAGPLPEGLTLYRGIESYADDLDLGDVIDGKGFGSFSVNPEVSENFAGDSIFRFVTDDNTPGGIVSSKMEEEVLLPPGERFAVRKVDTTPEGMRLVDLERTNKSANYPRKQSLYGAAAAAASMAALDADAAPPRSQEEEFAELIPILADAVPGLTFDDLRPADTRDDEALYDNRSTLDKITQPISAMVEPLVDYLTREPGKVAQSMGEDIASELSAVMAKGQGAHAFPSLDVRNPGMGGMPLLALASMVGPLADLAYEELPYIKEFVEGTPDSVKYDRQAQKQTQELFDTLRSSNRYSDDTLNQIAPFIRGHYRARNDPHYEIYQQMDELTK